MADPTNVEESVEDARFRDQDIERPAFVSEDVWKFVRLAAEQNKIPVRDYVEKALLDEAMILEQVSFGRKWLVQDKKGRTGEVDFN